MDAINIFFLHLKIPFMHISSSKMHLYLLCTFQLLFSSRAVHSLLYKIFPGKGRQNANPSMLALCIILVLILVLNCLILLDDLSVHSEPEVKTRHNSFLFALVEGV